MYGRSPRTHKKADPCSVNAVKEEEDQIFLTSVISANLPWKSISNFGNVKNSSGKKISTNKKNIWYQNLNSEPLLA